MTIPVTIVVLLVGLVAGVRATRPRRRYAPVPELPRPRRILLPFTDETLSCRALDAALRLARAEDAMLVPALLTTEPFELRDGARPPREPRLGLHLLDAVGRRAVRREIAVDSRVQAGSTIGHALEQLLAAEQFDRVIVSAMPQLHPGLSERDLLLLLASTSAEVMILRGGG